jgi:predicted permease
LRNLTFPAYLDFVQNARTIERFAAFQTRQLPVGEGDETREVPVTVASASYFSFFKARPALGRFFDAADDSVPAGRNVVVLGHAFWQARFGGDPGVLGKSLRVGQALCEIIGVAPQGFVGMTDQGVPAVYMPITAYAYSFRGPNYPSRYSWTWLEMIARRREGVSVAQTRAELTASYVATFRKVIEADPGWGKIEDLRPAAFLGPVQFERGPLAQRDSRVARWVSGVALIVLLIACANVANLLLSRAVSRQREIAVRLALGVSRARLVRQLMTESVVLAALGGIAGVLVAQWGASILRRFFFAADETIAVSTDGRTLLFAAAITAVVALLTGLVPALQAGRGDLAGALKAGAREGTYRRGRSRTALLVVQATLSVILLVGAGLFVRSLQNIRGYRLGYDTDRIVVTGANMRGVRLNEAETNALNERLLAAVREVPGVSHASLAASIPFWSNEGRGLWVSGVDSISRRGRFVMQAGSVDYFATTGTRIRRGRGFDASDHSGGPPVVVISEGMAGAIWGNEDAIGKCIRIGADTAPCSTVIGIAEEMRARSLTDEREFSYYIPSRQYDGPMGPQLFARVQGDPAALADDIRRRVQRELPGAAYAMAMPLDQLVDPQRRSWEFGATMFLVFGGLALVLAAIGLYSLIAYDVAQRTQELGVRLALGASVSDVVRLVMSSGVRLVAVGIILGGGLALWGSRWMEGLLFHQSPRDPLVFLAVAVTLLAVALVASSGPALRASRVDPNIALRGG